MRQAKIEFEEKRVVLFADTSDEELSPYFSDAKVPILLDADLVIWDTIAILEYVSENYLAGKGWPSDTKARALARSISAEMHSSFNALRNALPMNCRKKFTKYKITAEVQRDIERVKAIWRKCRATYGAQGDWLFGDYSIADAMYAPVVLRLEGYDVPLSGVEKSYVQTVLAQADIADWIAAGKEEKEVIAEDEVEI